MEPRLKLIKLVTIYFIMSAVSGCGIGQKKLLFVSKTNVGVDIDADRLTAQINIDREEAAIGPTFEGGKHVPLVAGFTNESRFLGGFGVSTIFAGGTAAEAFSTKWQSDGTNCGTEPNDENTAIKLTEMPKFKKGPFRKFWDLITSAETDEFTSLPGPGDVKPFIFSTDSSLGLKVAWSPSSATSGIPDKIQIGFNREELALAPLMVTNINDQAEIKNGFKYKVSSPSFLASLVSDTSFSDLKDSKLAWVQTFAVGTTATHIACDSAIRKDLQKKFSITPK
ncbi:hypothetical protein [Methylomonas methanica]|uniref:Lipoprotein n=1 Tax=Methylomonas methanica TaxID=421 RepID=A0A177MG28_METMH|nr:hypothetical protein [Methylomonas methanica]OAI03759.1 hypothetical protein A1332_15250 [Methylomonas methanica]